MYRPPDNSLEPLGLIGLALTIAIIMLCAAILAHYLGG